jgi:hypothetical protein
VNVEHTTMRRIVLFTACADFVLLGALDPGRALRGGTPAVESQPVLTGGGERSDP